MDQSQQIQELVMKMTKMQSQLDDVSAQVYKNNFSSSQTFNKDSVFTSRLRVPVYTSAPTVSEVGDLIAVAGKLYICTVANTTFELVGTQT